MAEKVVPPLRIRLMSFVYEFPFILRYAFFSVYCWLYKTVNTSFFIENLCAFYYSFISFFMGNQVKLEWKTHWQSPVCRAILRRKYFMTQSKSSLSWALYNFMLVFLLFIEIKNKSVSSWFGIYTDTIWYFECAVGIILALNTSMAFSLYIWSVFSKPMPISPIQQKLFRIDPNDPGFEIKNYNESISEVVKPERLQFTSWNESAECSFLSITPLNYSANSWASSPGSPGVDTTSSSWSFYRLSSPVNYSSTPKSLIADKVSPRILNHSEGVDSPYERPIKSKKQLEKFLKVYEDEDKNIKSLSFEDHKAFMGNVTSVDNSPMSVLSKCRYQRAYRIPHMETTEDDSSDMHCGDNMLHKLKITEKMLTVWSERLRKWICQTILIKLVQEIDDINNTLSHLGLPEFQIGNVSLFALHQIAVTKSQHLPTLSTVLPYLDLHLNQEYLVRRLKELARGGCMGEFKWNSGGTYDDKPWCDDLPTDSAIVMHIICCYLDAHLPPEPHFPEGKPFSSKFFKKVPEKLVLSKDMNYIYQSSINAPHYKVVIREDIYALQKGRNNLFCALLIFLHYLKVKECGMLGRVNLGKSGLNILWVLD